MKFIHALERDKSLAYLFLLPIALLLGLFALYPVSFAAVISFFHYKLGHGTRRFAGLDNYLTLIRAPIFWVSLKNSLLFAGASVSMELLLGLGVALLIHRDFFGAKVVRALILLPLMISGVVVGVMFLLIYHEQYGIANYILQTLPLFKPIGWLSDRRFALFSIILADVWQQTPFAILLLLAGLDAMPREPYEAAIIDGANKWQIFRFITLPLLRSVIYVALTLRLVVSLRVFDKVFLLTRGGPGTSTYILNLLGYEKALRHFKCGEATALVILIIILTLSVVFIIFKRAFAE